MKAATSFLLSLVLSLSSFTALWAAPRRDFAEQYRPDRQIVVDTRREDDSLRLFLRFPGNHFRPGQVMYVAAWASYTAKQPKWQYPYSCSQAISGRSQLVHGLMWRCP
ncbi:hypothetical protein [Hymenobacter sp. 5414T-23]|uniref:hypothetical protein n=1 Tax=Hymenobacter sp. 5414T-23 TaxID=2932252 RepID=UPI001FD01829|nr:hypothetical protein [Hymenobacter sp. 5414T-23]UOQ79833.1 hypothetical protein MUN83_13370 [Hymenobacter sp. 5414T-23]